MLEVIAEAAGPAAEGGWVAMIGAIILALLKIWTLSREAKEAKTDATRADAEARQKAAIAEATQKGLDALALYIEAQKRKQPEAEAKKTSSAIQAFTNALPGAENAVAATVVRLGLSSKSREAIPVVDADGTPKMAPPPLGHALVRWVVFIAVLALAVASLVLSGCVSTEQRATAEALHGRLALLRAASEPHHDYDEAGKAAWARLWSKALGASRALVESTGGNAAAAEQAAYEEARVAAGASSGEVR